MAGPKVPTNFPRTGPGGPGGIGPESPDAIRASTTREKLWDFIQSILETGPTTPLGKISPDNIFKFIYGSTPEEQVTSSLIDLGLHPVAIPFIKGEQLGVHATRSLFDYFRNSVKGHESQPWSKLINLAALRRELPKSEAIERASDYASGVASEARFSAPTRVKGTESLRNIPISAGQDLSILDFYTKGDPDVISPQEIQSAVDYILQHPEDYHDAEGLAKQLVNLWDTRRARMAFDPNQSFSILQDFFYEDFYDNHPTIKGMIYPDGTTGLSGVPYSSEPAIAISETAKLRTPWGMALTEAAETDPSKIVPEMLEEGYLPGFSSKTTKQLPEPYFGKETPWTPIEGQPSLKYEKPFPGFKGEPAELVSIGGQPRTTKQLKKWMFEHPLEVAEDSLEYNKLLQEKLNAGLFASPAEVDVFNIAKLPPAKSGWSSINTGYHPPPNPFLNDDWFLKLSSSGKNNFNDLYSNFSPAETKDMHQLIATVYTDKAGHKYSPEIMQNILKTVIEDLDQISTGSISGKELIQTTKDLATFMFYDFDGKLFRHLKEGVGSDPAVFIAADLSDAMNKGLFDWFGIDDLNKMSFSMLMDIGDIYATKGSKEKINDMMAKIWNQYHGLQTKTIG